MKQRDGEEPPRPTKAIPTQAISPQTRPDGHPPTEERKEKKRALLQEQIKQPAETSLNKHWENPRLPSMPQELFAHHSKVYVWMSADGVAQTQPYTRAQHRMIEWQAQHGSGKSGSGKNMDPKYLRLDLLFKSEEYEAMQAEIRREDALNKEPTLPHDESHQKAYEALTIGFTEFFDLVHYTVKVASRK